MFALDAPSQTITFQSKVEHTALLELYTSEGCSSCPPAEAWLSHLKAAPGLWKDFVPLAFHVDYWDYLGWRDSLGSRAFSDRQRAYAASWRSESVYTPGVVLNGKEWLDWSSQKEGPKIIGEKTGVLTVTSPDTNQWRAVFAPVAGQNLDYEIHAAVLAGSLSSDVKAGENRGRRLNHDFAVLSLVDAPLKRNGETFQSDFVLNFPQKNKENLALAIWVTRSGHLEPIQATGGFLGH